MGVASLPSPISISSRSAGSGFPVAAVEQERDSVDNWFFICGCPMLVFIFPHSLAGADVWSIPLPSSLGKQSSYTDSMAWDYIKAFSFDSRFHASSHRAKLVIFLSRDPYPMKRTGRSSLPLIAWLQLA